jgi:hypothetical protein
MSGLTLYEIDSMFQQRLAEAEAYAAEHDGVLPADLAQALDGLELARDAKIGNGLRAVKNIEAEAEAVAAEARKLADRTRSLTSKADWLRSYVGGIIGQGAKWSDTTCKASWRKSEYVELAADAQDKLPAQYVRYEPVIDKAAIRDTLKRGQEVPGAILAERISLQIR